MTDERQAGLTEDELRDIRRSVGMGQGNGGGDVRWNARWLATLDAALEDVPEGWKVIEWSLRASTEADVSLYGYGPTPSEARDDLAGQLRNVAAATPSAQEAWHSDTCRSLTFTESNHYRCQCPCHDEAATPSAQDEAPDATVEALRAAQLESYGDWLVENGLPAARRGAAVQRAGLFDFAAHEVAEPAGGLREALEETISMLDRLDAQARDGGGDRRQVYLTVEAWNEVFRPLRRRALAALAVAQVPAERLDVERLGLAIRNALWPKWKGEPDRPGLFWRSDAAKVAAEYAALATPSAQDEGKP